MKCLSLILCVSLLCMGCIHTTTTLPDGTVIDESAPDTALIVQSIEFAMAMIERYQHLIIVSPEEERMKFEMEMAKWELRLEALKSLLETVDGAETVRRLDLWR